MKGESRIFKGYYDFEDGRFIPRGEMSLIIKMLKRMKMLAGSTETGKGEFYLDPADDSYWHYAQSENYHTELRAVTREYIEANFPNVKCDKLIDVKWPASSDKD
jgi:hypothetical protein